MEESDENFFNQDYFNNDYFHEDDKDSSNQDELNDNLNNQNTYQNNNNIFQNYFNQNNINTNSLNSFNSFNSYNSTNFNSFSNFSRYNSTNSIRLNQPYQNSFQNNNNINLNINHNINNTKFGSDSNIKVNINRMTKNKLLEMTPEKIYDYLRTQKGSRQAQNIINKMNENEVEILLTKIIPNLSQIMSDKYGNYFSKKLIQICLPSQRIKILKNLGEDFINISKDSHGTHPLQFLIETINMPEEKNLVLSYIINNEYELAVDQKGTNVLKKFIIGTKGEERTELNNNLIKLIDKLIINQYGSIIFIILIKNTNNKDIYKQISQYISNNKPLYYVQHPYSNYVVQALLHFSDLEFCEDIIKAVLNNYLILSLKKNSNKVVEYCIKSAKSSTVKKIFNDVLDKNNLESLINNCYGNFVLEKLIMKLNRDEKNIINNKIEELGLKGKISNSIKSLLEK